MPSRFDSKLEQVASEGLGEFKHAEENVEEATIARLTEEDLFILSQESLQFKSWTTFRLFLMMFVQGCGAAGFGIDWAVISGINAFKPWHAYFGFGTSGVTYGTLNALMTIGTVCGAPFMAFADIIGRRGINFAGNFIVLFASLLQAFSINISMFMAGRFFLGFGSALMSSPQYVAEVAPTHLRGRLVGLFGACFQVGSLCMNAGLIGLANIESKLVLENSFGTRRIVAEQIEDSLQNERQNNRSYWDYRVLFHGRSARYRLFVLVLYSIFQQWNGGGVIGQYLVPALDTIGITGTTEQLGMNFGLNATYLVFTVCGSLIIDRFRRRTLIFTGLICFILLQTAATITSWRYTLTESKVDAGLVVTWLFLFQTCSSLLIATMHNLYPVEILSLDMRAKGMGLYALVQGAAGTVQNYGISVGIQKIGYKIWVVYVGYNLIQLALSYFVFPETSELTLEEIDTVFETPGVRPVKMSLDIQKAKKERARLEGEGTSSGVQY
ncbi:hypothetical protein DID88_002043 [Monilinia fructigena]|uniref:Major facilitator superfamily (MFS) profile domain-containing protein n=1 Tax=Monilinia fructigena TaxID=38457 RepID=A0A395IV17_9HELO|nr:hypothetical protein DID88_002043 [Monilinia fructigena]